MTDLTGVAPTLVEAWNPIDTGVWDMPLASGVSAVGEAVPAYDLGGAWGEDQFAAYVYPASAGAGYGETLNTYQVFITAYRPTDGRAFNDAMVYAALERVRAAGTVIWFRISDLGTIVMTEGGDPITSESGGTFTVESI